MEISIISPPREALTLTEVKNYLKVSVSDTSEDALISRLIKTAREYCEMYTAEAFTPRLVQCKYYPSDFEVWGFLSWECVLPYGPINAITECGEMMPDSTIIGIDYTQAGNIITGAQKPTTNITITYTCGYTTGTLPSAYTDAMLKVIATMYDERSMYDERQQGRNMAKMLMLTHASRPFCV